MFPDVIIKILTKHQNTNEDTVLDINKSINDIILYLNKINDNISIQIKNLITDKNIDFCLLILYSIAIWK